MTKTKSAMRFRAERWLVVAAVLSFSGAWSPTPARANGNSCVANPSVPTTWDLQGVTFLKAENYAVCALKVATLTSTARIEEHLFGPVWKARGATGTDACHDCRVWSAESNAECMEGTFRTEGRAVGVFYPNDTGDPKDDSLSGNRDIDCPIPIKP